MNDDLISRQAAIDFIDAGHLCNPNEPRWSDNEIVNFLKSRPPAQPETHEERTETHACDCISRKTAIDAMGKAQWAKERLMELPSAQPERPKGRWMICDNQEREDIENGNYMYTCTNCLHSDVHAKTVTVPFCWNCGARMEETT